jgi:hypothetical protein
MGALTAPRQRRVRFFSEGTGGWHWAAGWTDALILGALTEFACFVPVGFAATTLLPPVRDGAGGARSILPAWRRNCTTALPCVTRPPGPGAWRRLSVRHFLLGCLLGAWAGVTWRRGWRPLCSPTSPCWLWAGPCPGGGMASLEEVFSFEVPPRSAVSPTPHLECRGSPGSPSHEQTRTLQGGATPRVPLLGPVRNAAQSDGPSASGCYLVPVVLPAARGKPAT